MPPTLTPLPDPSSVPSQKTVVTLLAGGLIGAVAALGGATLVSPSPSTLANADLYVHQVRMVRLQSNSLPQLSAYSTVVRHLLDGGASSKDQGEVTCGAAGAPTLKLLAALDAACAGGGWLHVVELRLNPADGGTVVESYASHLTDAGATIDDGRVQKCEAAAAQDVSDLVFQEALNCAEGALDRP